MATGITGLFSAGDLASAENQAMRDRAMAVAKLGKGEAGAYAAGLGSGMLIEGLAGMAGMKTSAATQNAAGAAIRMTGSFDSTGSVLINVEGAPQLNIKGIPTSDPGVVGQVWRDGTDLKISIG